MAKVDKMNVISLVNYSIIYSYTWLEMISNDKESSRVRKTIVHPVIFIDLLNKFFFYLRIKIAVTYGRSIFI